MNKHHKLRMGKRVYSGSRRVIECDECPYMFVLEIDQNNVLQMNTKILIHRGDPTASHEFFQTPDIGLRFSFSTDAESKNKKWTNGEDQNTLSFGNLM